MNQPTLKPLHDRILLQAPPKPDMGGLVLPENFQMPKLKDGKLRHLKLKVLAVGDGCKLVKAGDEIVVNENATYEVNVDDTTHLMVDEKLVLAVVS